VIPLLNLTVRSAGDLLADLTACRQFRHLTDSDRHAVCTQAFSPHRHEYQAPVYKTSMGLTCSVCGRPRSDHGAINKTSKCIACYRNTAIERVVWIADAFTLVMQNYGYSCDTCGEVVEVKDGDCRRAADRALDNLDGIARLLLCKRCSIKFKAFATREFDREARSKFDSGLEKIMVAFLAKQVYILARRVTARSYAT
jgi:hypothetical protein